MTESYHKKKMKKISRKLKESWEEFLEMKENVNYGTDDSFSPSIKKSIEESVIEHDRDSKFILKFSGGQMGALVKLLSEMVKKYEIPIERDERLEIKDIENNVIEVLHQCYHKIDLYNKNNQEYLGGVEATRLLSNIKEVLELLAGSDMVSK